MTVDFKKLRVSRQIRYWRFVRSYRNKLLQSQSFRGKHSSLSVKEFSKLTMRHARKDVGATLKKFRRDIHRQGMSNEYYFDVIVTRQKAKERWGIKDDDLSDLPEGADT